MQTVKNRLLAQHILPSIYLYRLTVEGRTERWKHVTGKSKNERKVLKGFIFV
jgi:hypothetical protein